MTPKEYKQEQEEFKNLCAEQEFAYDLAMNDGGAAIRRNERNWEKFYEKWHGIKPNTQKTLDLFKRKTKHKVRKSSKRTVK